MATTQKTKQASKRKKSRVLIVDDHPILRQGLRQMIDLEDDLEVCSEAETSHQALDAIRTAAPGIAIVDITLKNSNGIDLVKDIKRQYPKLPVLVLSMHDESLYAERALRAGARGYIMKREPSDLVLTAIRQILSGKIYVSEPIANRMLSSMAATGDPQAGPSPLDRLSNREFEIFKLIGQGHGRGQIAEELHLSVKTIETHRAKIQEKLNLKNSAELLQFAIQWFKTAEPA